jgi:hypothetical protein
VVPEGTQVVYSNVAEGKELAFAESETVTPPLTGVIVPVMLEHMKLLGATKNTTLAEVTSVW